MEEEEEENKRSSALDHPPIPLKNSIHLTFGKLLVLVWSIQSTLCIIQWGIMVVTVTHSGDERSAFIYLTAAADAALVLSMLLLCSVRVRVRVRYAVSRCSTVQVQEKK